MNRWIYKDVLVHKRWHGFVVSFCSCNMNFPLSGSIKFYSILLYNISFLDPSLVQCPGWSNPKKHTCVNRSWWAFGSPAMNLQWRGWSAAWTACAPVWVCWWSAARRCAAPSGWCWAWTALTTSSRSGCRHRRHRHRRCSSADQRERKHCRNIWKKIEMKILNSDHERLNAALNYRYQTDLADGVILFGLWGQNKNLLRELRAW